MVGRALYVVRDRINVICEKDQGFIAHLPAIEGVWMSSPIELDVMGALSAPAYVGA